MALGRIYAVGVAFIGVAAIATVRSTGRGRPQAEAEPHVVGPAASSSARAWFASVKPYCNTVEVETALRQSRPPSDHDFESAGFEAACWALAGRIDDARRAILTLPADERWRGAGIVFEVAHPVADAGDDRSAGPIMGMVAEFWPNHYMALYHAGMSAVALGQSGVARRHLEAFLQHYSSNDGWRGSAEAALKQLR